MAELGKRKIRWEWKEETGGGREGLKCIELENSCITFCTLLGSSFFIFFFPSTASKGRLLSHLKRMPSKLKSFPIVLSYTP